MITCSIACLLIRYFYVWFIPKCFIQHVCFDITGKDEPKAPSLHIKPKDPKPFVTPSPGAYNPVSFCL